MAEVDDTNEVVSGLEGQFLVRLELLLLGEEEIDEVAGLMWIDLDVWILGFDGAKSAGMNCAALTIRLPNTVVEFLGYRCIEGDEKCFETSWDVFDALNQRRSLACTCTSDDNGISNSALYVLENGLLIWRPVEFLFHPPTISGSLC